MGKGLLVAKELEALFKLSYTEVTTKHEYKEDKLNDIYESMCSNYRSSLEGKMKDKNFYFYLAAAETGKLANRTTVTDNSAGDEDSMVSIFEAGPNSKCVDCM